MQPTLQEQTLIIYDGDRLDNGLYHGFGRAVFSSGQVYEGQWAAGHMHGAGRVTFPDGITYQGSFTTDRITRTGVYNWCDAVYEGELLDGERHGYGTLTFAGSAVVYEGQWQFGKRHGSGTIHYNEQKTAYYEGQWQDDMKHGQGTSMYPSGNSYTGSWLHDKRHGHGTMKWVTKGQVYDGEWINDLPNGLGEHVWQQGTASLQASNHAMHVMFNRYHGMFKDGHRHGEGTLWYSNGARYEGQWVHDRKEGEGIYVFEDGSLFVGQFKADRPVYETGKFLGATSVWQLDDATDVTDTAGGQVSSSDASSATAGLSGFGPRVSCLQLYISDLLQERDAPAVTYKSISNMRVLYNTELRALYDRYSNRTSPLLDCSAPRNSWALQAGQLWELLKDSQLLCRQLQLQQASVILHKVLQPPPAVAQRRQQVATTAEAPAVTRQSHHLFDPNTELLFRDLCEFLVRVAAMRYPQLPCLEQQVQQLIAQNLLPLVGPASAKVGGYRQSVTSPNRSSMMSPVAAVSSSATSTGPGSTRMSTAPASAGAGKDGPEQLQPESLTSYLQSQAEKLKQVYAIFAAAPGAAQPLAVDSVRQGQQVQAVLADNAVPNNMWLDTAVTVRQVVTVLQQASVLHQWQLDGSVVASLLLDGFLSIAEPATPRAHIDEADLEPNDIEQSETLDSSQDAVALSAQRELAYWMDAPLLLIEVLWGLVRCAAAMPAHLSADGHQDAQDATGADDSCTARDLLPRLQHLVEGKGGLLSLLPGGKQHDQVQTQLPLEDSPLEQVVADGGQEVPVAEDGTEAPGDGDDGGESVDRQGDEVEAGDADASRPTTTQSSARLPDNSRPASAAVQEA